MIPLNFRDIYRASHVKRWHVVNVHRQQTLAEHMWLVTMTALEVSMRIKKEVEPGGIVAALTHDLPEVRYGDIPTPGKRMLREQGRDLEKIETELMSTLPVASGMWADIIKLADLFEAMFYIEENGYGRHAENVAHVTRFALNDFVRSMQLKWPGHDWHETVNGMLSDVGSLPLQPMYGE